MRVRIEDKFAKFKEITMQSVPRIGDNVQLTYEPAPKVKEVIWITDGQTHLDAIVILD